MKFTHVLCSTMLAVAAVSSLHADGAVAASPAKDAAHTSNPHEHWLGVNVLVGASQYRWKSKYGRLYRTEGAFIGSSSPHDSRTPRMNVLEAGLGVSLLRSFTNISVGVDVAAFPSSSRIKLQTSGYSAAAGYNEILDMEIKKNPSYRARFLAGNRVFDNGLCYAAVGVSRESFTFTVKRTLSDLETIVTTTNKKSMYVPEYAIGYRHSLDGERYIIGGEFGFQLNGKRRGEYVFKNSEPDETQVLKPIHRFNKYSVMGFISIKLF